MGISAGRLYEWKKSYHEIDEALKRGKAPVDIEVENALLKRARGYEVEETITEIYNADGVERKHIRKVKKHIPPDVTAQIFWLKNRRPDRWRDKPPDASSLAEPVQVIVDV